MREYVEDWEKSLNIDERFSWANEAQKAYIMAEIKYQREQGWLRGIAHEHDWLVQDYNRPYRDEYRNEFIQDTYVCECGAGSYVRTPLEMFLRGEKVLAMIRKV